MDCQGFFRKKMCFLDFLSPEVYNYKRIPSEATRILAFPASSRKQPRMDARLFGHSSNQKGSTLRTTSCQKLDASAEEHIGKGGQSNEPGKQRNDYSAREG